MTKFTVHWINGTVTHYNEEAKYHVKDGQLHIDDGEGMEITASAAGWMRVEQAKRKSAYER